MTARWKRDDLWTVLARRQEQVLGWRQLREWGWTTDDVRRPIDSGHWRRLEPGVFATTTAPLSPRGAVWQAVLATGGVACGTTALRLAGGTAAAAPGRRDAVPEVAVPWSRRATSTPQRSVHRHRDLRAMTKRGSSPPRVTVAAATAEVAARYGREEDVVGLVLAVVQQRLCTASDLRAEWARSPTARWRGLVTAMLGEVADGVLTHLELRYARDVERVHGLPVPSRNTDLGLGGMPQVVDVWYRDWNVVVELDGRLAHPDHLRFRDAARDNRVVVAGMVPLRFGWHDVVGSPCGVAEQVVRALRRGGWGGAPLRCGSSCTLG